MADYKFIVIGAGVSGAMFAERAADMGSVLVLDAKDRTGGCLCSAVYDDFWLELGGHTVYSSYASYINSLGRVNLFSRFLPRVRQPFKMLTADGLVPIKKVMSFSGLFLNGWRLFFLKKDGKTVKEYWSAVMGSRNYEKMFRPMVAAVLSQEGSDFPADMMLKSRPKDKSMPRSFTLFGGMDFFVKKALSRDNITVKASCGAVSAVHEGGIYNITASTGEVFTSENLVIACYPFEASIILKAVSPEISEILGSIPSAKVESMGIIVNKEDVTLDTLSFIVAQDAPFTSVVSRDVVRDAEYRGFTFHFKPDRLGYEQKLAEAEKVLGIKKDKFLSVQETLHLCPTLAKGHEKNVERTDSLLKNVKGLYITGNYFTGLAIEDCAIRSRKEAERAVKEDS